MMEGGSVIYDLEDKNRVIGRDLALRFPWKNRYSVLGGTKYGIPIRIIFGKGAANTYTLAHYCFWKGYLKTSGGWTTCVFGDREPVKVQGLSGKYQWVRENFHALADDFYSGNNAVEYTKALSSGFSAEAL